MNQQLEFTLHIGGMTCLHCGQHVTSALEEVPGVERAEVSDWKSALAIVVAAERIVPEMLLAAVIDAGYTATFQA